MGVFCSRTPFYLTMEPRNLDETLGNAFFAKEQEEAKSREIENLIKSCSGASALLPSRQYEKPINPEKFGITIRSII